MGTYERLITGQLLLALFFSANAYAMRGDAAAGMTAAELRHEAQAAAKIRITGALSCASAAASECAKIALKEDGTGKIYQLTNAAQAVNLFQAGTKNVAVEGTLAGEDTIQINRIETL